MHTQTEIWKQSHVSSKLNLKVQLSFIFMCCTVKVDTTIQNLQNCEIVMFRPVTQAHRHTWKNDNTARFYIRTWFVESLTLSGDIMIKLL